MFATVYINTFGNSKIVMLNKKHPSSACYLSPISKKVTGVYSILTTAHINSFTIAADIMHQAGTLYIVMQQLHALWS